MISSAAMLTSDAIVFSGEHNDFYFKTHTEQEFTKNSYVAR